MVRLFLALSMLVVLAGLVGWNFVLYDQPIDTSAIVYKGPKAAASGEKAKQAALVTAENRRLVQPVQTLSRPLFTPTRRPFVQKPAKPAAVQAPKPVVAEVQPPREPPQLVLLGISGAPGGNRALVKVDDQSPRWVTAEEVLGGWTVEDVDATGISLILDDQKIAYSLYPDAVGNQAPPPAPADSVSQ